MTRVADLGSRVHDIVYSICGEKCVSSCLSRLPCSLYLSRSLCLSPSVLGSYQRRPADFLFITCNVACNVAAGLTALDQGTKLNQLITKLNAGLTALDPRENDFDNMLRCVKELKEGKSVMKPIYNHVNGTLDADEKIEPTPIIIFEVFTTYALYTINYLRGRGLEARAERDSCHQAHAHRNQRWGRARGDGGGGGEEAEAAAGSSGGQSCRQKRQQN